MKTDAKRLAAVVDGHESAFVELYDATADAVLRFAWTLAPDLATAQDIVQETYLTLWRKAARVTTVNGSALPWLLVTVRNLARNRARRDRRWRELVDLHEASLLSDPQQGEAAAELRWALDSIAALPPTDRRVCELCLLHGYTHAEAARSLGLSEAAVSKRISRVRLRLREARSPE